MLLFASIWSNVRQAQMCSIGYMSSENTLLFKQLPSMLLYSTKICRYNFLNRGKVFSSSYCLIQYSFNMSFYRLNYKKVYLIINKEQAFFSLVV